MMLPPVFKTKDNLPMLTDKFVGRENYKEAVLHALLDTKAWIISIDGLGGVGKSRLALEVAHQIKEMGRYSAIVWVSAKGSWLTSSGIEKRAPSLTSLDDLLRKIISIAEEGENPIEDFDERKARVLKLVSQSPYLLIIDNLETVREDDRKSIINFLNQLSERETGETKALITSREATSPGAIVIELGGLKEEEGIQLILEDAKSFNEDSLLYANNEFLHEIWQQCAGLPLAIKWTVAMVARKKLTLFDTLSELRKSTGNVLDYIFSSVFENLTEDGKSLLYTSAVFISSFPGSAYEGITALSNKRVRSAISELLGLYLIHRTASLLPKPSDEQRYIILPATKLCVQAICGENPGLCDEYIVKATEFYLRLWTGFTPNFGVEQFDDDYQNSTYLLDWCFRKQQWPNVVNLVKRMDLYLSVRGLADDRIEACNLGVLAAFYIKDGRSVVEFKAAKGKAYKQKGMYPEAEEQFRECSEFYRNTNMDKELAGVRMQLGILLEHQVEYTINPVTENDKIKRLEEARGEYSEAYETYKRLGDRAGEAQTLHLIGRVYRHLNIFDKSEGCLMQSMNIKQELGDAVRIAITNHELARLRHLQGRKQEAEMLYKNAIAILTESGATKDLANANWRYSLLLREDPKRLQEAKQRNVNAVVAYQQQGRRRKYELALADLQQLEAFLNAQSESNKKDSEEGLETILVRIQEPRNRVFISYSHADTEWLKRLRVHLRPLERAGVVDIFDDTMIQPGSDWRKDIESAIASAKFALLLISADFLASDFIQENELPPLLKAAEEEGARIIPIIVSPCGFEHTESLARFQALNSPSRPLTSLNRNDQEQILSEIPVKIGVLP